MDLQSTELHFIDRTLHCADCRADFIFTAGEQIFFFDKQFKNDPKRCKSCKSRRSSLSAAASPAAAGITRVETRTLCSDCGIETTVPFKPTQGRPVLCRQCFQVKARAVAAAVKLPQNLTQGGPGEGYGEAATIAALTALSTNQAGAILSQDAAVLAAASMAGASAQSSVATASELASISELERCAQSGDTAIPAELVAAAGSESRALELLEAAAGAPEA